MRALRKLRDGLAQLESWLAAMSLLLLICLAVLQVLARNLFDVGITAADTLTRYLVLYVTFFGAAVAVHHHRHIRLDICSVLLSPATLRALYRPLRAIAALVCGLLATAAVRFWLDEWQYAPDHERWEVLAGLVIPLGFVLLSAQFLLGAILGREPE